MDWQVFKNNGLAEFMNAPRDFPKLIEKETDELKTVLKRSQSSHQEDSPIDYDQMAEDIKDHLGRLDMRLKLWIRYAKPVTKDALTEQIKVKIKSVVLATHQFLIDLSHKSTHLSKAWIFSREDGYTQKDSIGMEGRKHITSIATCLEFVHELQNHNQIDGALRELSLRNQPPPKGAKDPAAPLVRAALNKKRREIISWRRQNRGKRRRSDSSGTDRRRPSSLEDQTRGLSLDNKRRCGPKEPSPSQTDRLVRAERAFHEGGPFWDARYVTPEFADRESQVVPPKRHASLGPKEEKTWDDTGESKMEHGGGTSGLHPPKQPSRDRPSRDHQSGGRGSVKLKKELKEEDEDDHLPHKIPQYS